MTINVVAWTLSDGALVKTGNIPTDSLNAMLAKVKKISDSALSHAFYVCKGLTGSVSFPALTSIGSIGLYQAFRSCTGLTSVSFPKLTSIGNSGLYYTFGGCTGLTGSVSFPALTSIGNSGLYYTFGGCTGLTGSVSFPALTSIGSSGLYNTFNGCTNLTEVHFPAALSGNSQCTASYLGCTNATVYFDL